MDLRRFIAGHPASGQSDDAVSAGASYTN